MSNNIELLSNTENFTIGTNSNLSEILANVVKVGTDTSNVTISIPQDISSSYNLILPVRQGASGESLVYGADGQLKWDDPTVLKQVVSVYGSTLTANLISTTGTHDSPTYLDAYTANIVPMADNSKIFVQFKVNYHAALSASNQISFYIKKTDTNGNTLATFSESLFGPYNAAGGFTGQYISNLVDEALTSSSISYQLGYQINGNVSASDVLGILGYDSSHNNTIVLQEFEGSGVYSTSVWNKGSDSNGLYYNDGTVHIGSSKNALGSQNTPGVALELSGNLVGTNATFSGNIYAQAFIVEEAHIGPNTLFINGMRVLNQNDNGSINVYTDKIISEASNGLTIKAIGDNGSIILDPSGTGTIQLNGDVQLSGGNINAETFIGDLSGNVSAKIIAATTTTTNEIIEYTSNSGVTIESVLIKDGNVNGNLVGNVNGNLLGNVTGNLVGDVTGNVTGNLVGDVTGNLVGDVTGNLVGDVTGNLVGDVTGNVTGNLVGDVTGNLVGDVTGNVTGNLVGDVTGNVTGNLVGNVTGNLVGGNVTSSGLQVNGLSYIKHPTTPTIGNPVTNFKIDGSWDNYGTSFQILMGRLVSSGSYGAAQATLKMVGSGLRGMQIGEQDSANAYLLVTAGRSISYTTPTTASYMGHYFAGIVFQFNGSSVSSDDRLKWEEEDITNGLEVINKLKPQIYWKGEKLNVEPSEEERTRESGYIAQEVKQIPELAHIVKQVHDKDNTPERYFLDYTQIHAYHTSAIQELHIIVKNQQNTINILNEENTIIKNALNQLLSDAGKPTI